MMNKDKFEQFIINRQAAFDDKEPPKMAWGKIQEQLNKNNKAPRRISLWYFTRVAAAIIIILGTGIYIGKQMTSGTPIASIEESFPEFAEAKKYYEVEVSEKLAQLASYNYDTSLEEDMAQLDKFMNELRSELEEAPKGAEEQIINTMITNYQTKLDILERVLESLKSTNQVKNTKDEEVNI